MSKLPIEVVQRMQKRLDAIERLVEYCAGQLGITRSIRVVVNGATSVNATICEARFLRPLWGANVPLTISVNRGLLEVDNLPLDYLCRLVAHELAHAYYNDTRISDIFLLGDVAKFVSCLKELRADLKAKEILGGALKDIEASHYHTPSNNATFDYKMGYPTKRFRVYAMENLSSFGRDAMKDLVDLLHADLLADGYVARVTLSDVDAHIKNLSKLTGWADMWPK